MKRSELFQIIDINMDFLTKIDYTEIRGWNYGKRKK